MKKRTQTRTHAHEMAQDGSIEVAWKGQAFPYLIHHPNGLQTENYGSARESCIRASFVAAD